MYSDSINSSIALSRFADGLKLSAAVAVVEQFTTRESAVTIIEKVFRILGNEIMPLVGSDEAFHLFLNPDISEAHILDCSGKYCYRHVETSIRIALDKRDSVSWLYYASKASRQINSGIDLANNNALWEMLKKPSYYVVAPFCQRDIPLGYFVFTWKDDNKLPDFLMQHNTELREISATILNFLQQLVTRLLTNHRPIHRDTYLPRFMEATTTSVAILFADIRNFTSAFEAMRLRIPGEKQNYNPLVGLVKAYLAAASEIIAQPGIGRIDKFIGDGIMSTFGEYLTCKGATDKESEDNRQMVACMLAMYSAAMLIDAFTRLFAHFLELDGIKRFLKAYNERFDLHVGVGINFGEATFDYFGTTVANEEDSSKLIGGYLEYTAIGDNVNTAQRLESLASKPAEDVSIIERSQSHSGKPYTSPIMISRTCFLRTQPGLYRPNNESLSEYCRACVVLKGKNSIAETYEVSPNDINGDFLLLTLGNVGLDRLKEPIEKAWKDKRFIYSDRNAKDLIDKYCL
jgi:class 3 adenylate cyclase